MKRGPFFILLLLVAGGILLLVATGGKKGDGPEDEKGEKSAGSRSGVAKSERAAGARPGKSALAPRDAAKRMRALLDEGVKDAPSFEEIDALARRLSDDDLREFIERAGLANMQALVPWVRCALYAEWGRRDPEVAMAYLRNPETPNSTEGWSARQAWFSLFRGWSERDPEAARAVLMSADFRAVHEALDHGFGEAMRWDRYWQDYAYEAVFRELMRREGASAWEKIPSVGSQRASALRGIFWGAETKEERFALVTRWGPEWFNPAGSGNASSYQSIEALGISAAVSLLDFNPRIAWAWLHNNAPFIARGDIDLQVPLLRTNGHYQKVLVQWAALRPEKAVERLASAAPDEVNSLVQGVLMIDLDRGIEAISHIENQEERYKLLERHVQHGSFRLSDFFPGLGQATQFPGQPGRREALAALIAAGRFSAEQEASLQGKLEHAFSSEP